MANQLVTPTWVMMETTVMLVNSLKFSNNINRSYSSEFVQGGAKVGRTVNARIPQRYQVNKGQALVIQPVVDNIVPITITDQANVGIEFSSESLALEVDLYQQRYIAPAVNALAAVMDYDGMSRMTLVTYYQAGTPGVVPGSTGTLPQAANSPYLALGVKLDGAASPTPRNGVITSDMHANLVNGNITLFNPGKQIAEQYRTGKFSDYALGVNEWFWSQSCYTHTVGPLGGTPLVNGATQQGSSIASDGWTAAASRRLNAGDVIQFAGVYQVNPLNYQSTNKLMDFVVTENFDSTAGGAGNIPILPALVPSGQNQNVSNVPADNAAITTFGAVSTYQNVVTPQGLIFNPDAFAMVMVDLPKPGGVWVSERISNKELGVSVRMVKDYNVMTDESPARVDCMYGYAGVRNEFAGRVCS